MERGMGSVQSVDFEITVPRGFDLDIEGVALDVDIQGTEGEVEVGTVHGPITVVGGRGPFPSDSVNGDDLSGRGPGGHGSHGGRRWGTRSGTASGISTLKVWEGI